MRRKEQVNRHKNIDGRVEAHIVAIACSEAPEGRERRTLRLIADEQVCLGAVESISDTAVMYISVLTILRARWSAWTRQTGS